MPPRTKKEGNGRSRAKETASNALPTDTVDPGQARAIEAITGELVGSVTTEEAVLGDAAVGGAISVAAEIVPVAEEETSKFLTVEERDRLLTLEREVEESFYRAGKALQEIRDSRLYRETHHTFEDYCFDRFGFKRRHPYQLIDAAIITDNIRERARDAHILPTNEYQIRPLTRLRDDPEKQAEAWRRVVEKSQGKKPTFQVVKETVDEVMGTTPKARKAEPGALLSKGKFSVIRSSSDPYISDRKGYWGQIEGIDPDGRVTLTLYDRTVENISPSDLSPLREKEKEDREREKLLSRLKAVHEGIEGAERAVELLMHHFGTLREVPLTPLEEKLLEVLERQARESPL